MKTTQIVERIDEVLKRLPKDRTAIEIEKRYAGPDILVSAFAQGIELLQKLRDQLAQE